MAKYKNEMCKQYGDWLVVGMEKARDLLSGLVRWKCKCKYCSTSYFVRGAYLRNGLYRKHCKCRQKRKWKTS